MNESLVIVEWDQILSRIRGEYMEMPGLRLTRAQAQRLWGLDEQTCLALLLALEQAKFLWRSHTGRFRLRADWSSTES